MQSFNCIMPFIDSSESFVNGYECGQIDQKLKNGSRLYKYLVHMENSAQIQMICDLYSIKCFIEYTNDTWGLLTTHSLDDPHED